jgi:hypothetical protein
VTRRRGLIVAAALALAPALTACGTSEPIDVALTGLAVSDVEPAIIVSGTTIAITGDSFVDSTWGDSVLRLRGNLGGRAIDVALPTRFVDYDHLTAAVDVDAIAALGAGVDLEAFAGDAIVEVVSGETGGTYTSPPLPVRLDVAAQLTPAVGSVQNGGVIFANDPIAVEGSGLLLGGGEGESVATVTGCFQPSGSPTCTPVEPREVPLAPAMPFSRDKATFRFVPAIAGIHGGRFRGEVAIANHHQDGPVIAAEPVAVSYDLVTAQVFRVSPPRASLGQYVMIEGGGFVGGEARASTEIRLQGTFLPTGAPQGAPVDLLLIPEYESGNRVRYVVSSDDALGMAIDLRSVTGTFTGTIQPIVRYRGESVIGPPRPVTLGIDPVKQVVQLDFRPSYVESLRRFGLRAVDGAIRARVLEVVRRAYPGVNIEFRTEPVTDFALFSSVELHGPDPNGQGLFGYDNTPGKDSGNQRLYDRLGGVNAMTQQDGFAGYGGVFIESLMGFSQHPPVGVSIPGADSLFDDVFDPFRPDCGSIALSADVSGGLPGVTGASCPAGDRKTQLACAVFVMGNLIGGTLAHELGHSLGLANPFGEGFHDDGDEPGRLMDAGGDRPFPERAELLGQGPAVFCAEEYEYLRMILPSALPADDSPRPRC